MSYSVMGSKNNSCWPVPMGQFRTMIGPRGGGGGGRRSMGALMQATAGTGLFRNAPWRAMGDVAPGNYSIDPSSGVAVANLPATKGLFMDLQTQANRVNAAAGYADLVTTVDGIVGPNTQAAVQFALQTASLDPTATLADSIASVAMNADTIDGMLQGWADASGVPPAPAVAAAKVGGGSGASPAPTSAVAKNNAVRTPIMFAGIDFSDPTTLAVVAAAGIGAYLIGKKNKRGGGGRRRAPRRRAKRAPRRRAATRRTRARRRGRR